MEISVLSVYSWELKLMWKQTMVFDQMNYTCFMITTASLSHDAFTEVATERWTNEVYEDSPRCVELHQPQTVTLDHLPVEVGRVQLHDIVTGRVKSLDGQDQGATQHSYMDGSKRQKLQVQVQPCGKPV